jgi:DNA-binding transcriptional ArsR family regulator
MASSTQMTHILSFFKALADESRLKIVGALASEERTVEELASLLQLRAPTVSHHLSKLKEVGLVSMKSEGTTHIYQLNVDELRQLSKQVLSLETIGVDDSIAIDAWERKVLNDFFEGQRLKEIPASRKKREVVLRWLADQFEHDRQYPEKEVNTVIGRHHPDFATLRRELIGAQLLNRENAVYWRPRNLPDAVL